MKYDIEYVKDLTRGGERLKFILFWGNTEKGGEVTKACLSQWYPCIFTVDGTEYSTAEQYMMERKAALFHDEEIRQRIMEASHPKQYKALGQKVKGFSQEVWDREKYRIVLEGNIAKFSQNTALGDFLLKSGGRILVEASPYDKIWGIGMSADDEHAEDPLLWKGQNLLGFALMEARDILRGQAEQN